MPRWQIRHPASAWTSAGRWLQSVQITPRSTATAPTAVETRLDLALTRSL